MGIFGIRERNERGEGLIRFAEKHKLIAVALFQKKKKTKADTGLGIHRNLSEQTLLRESKKTGFQSVCVASNEIWMPNMVSYASIS